MIDRMETHAPERKKEMNQSEQLQAISVSPTSQDATPDDQELLTRWGFTAEESASLLWLRQWYQTGGSDRASVVRYLEFLRLLVRSGELEL